MNKEKRAKRAKRKAKEERLKRHGRRRIKVTSDNDTKSQYKTTKGSKFTVK